MAEAGRKEKNELVKKVGSASTWGSRERERFGIPQEGVEVDAFELVGREWFDMEGLTTTQQESILLEYNADYRISIIADYSRIRDSKRYLCLYNASISANGALVVVVPSKDSRNFFCENRCWGTT